MTDTVWMEISSAGSKGYIIYVKVFYINKIICFSKMSGNMVLKRLKFN